MLPVAHLNLGQLLASRGLCEEAEVVLRHCSKLDSTGVKDPKLHETTRISALVHLGRLLADSGRFNEAISIYRNAVDSLPEYYQPQVIKRDCNYDFRRFPICGSRKGWRTRTYSRVYFAAKRKRIKVGNFENCSQATAMRKFVERIDRLANFSTDNNA